MKNEFADNLALIGFSDFREFDAAYKLKSEYDKLSNSFSHFLEEFNNKKLDFRDKFNMDYDELSEEDMKEIERIGASSDEEITNLNIKIGVLKKECDNIREFDQKSEVARIDNLKAKLETNITKYTRDFADYKIGCFLKEQCKTYTDYSENLWDLLLQAP